VNQYENATFNCTATGPGDLKIEWTCSDDSNYGVTSTSNGSVLVASTLVITRATRNLTVTCNVIQNLSSMSSGNVEVRLPWPIQTTAQLIFIPVLTPTTQPVTQPPAVTQPVIQPATQPESISPGSEVEGENA
jgi:hypothetical protein